MTIASSALFQVQKISTDLTGDPAVLLAGETLRYTLTLRNIGNDDAVDAVLRDAIPVNTTYVPGSTTLNGSPLADVSGLSPLVNGTPIQTPADPAPGSMPADPSSGPTTVATVTFDVVVDPDVIDRTIICNQGFVSALQSNIADYPSDDPATDIPNDPTCDIIGNYPLLYAEKRAELSIDLLSPGIVDPGDTLRYTITVQNSGGVPATGVVLTDQVPANTTYVANSTQLNGLPVGQPDGGVSPLASGIDISSSDLTPPLPDAGAGTLSPGAAAVLQFELRVDDGTPAGTLIINQAVATSIELGELLTDGDGNPATGPEPTVVVVGAGQQLAITKEVAVVGGGPAIPGAVLEYLVTVTNIAAVPAHEVDHSRRPRREQPGIPHLCGRVRHAERRDDGGQLRRHHDHRGVRRDLRHAGARRDRHAAVPRDARPGRRGGDDRDQYRRRLLEHAAADGECQRVDRRRGNSGRRRAGRRSVA